MSEGKHTPRATRQSVSDPIVEPGRKDCIFCRKLLLGKKHKYQKTSQCQSLNAAQKVLDAAEVRENNAIRIAIGSLSCPIAREVHYHRDSFRHYTRVLEDKNDIDLSDSTGGEAQVLASFLAVVHKKDVRHRKRSSWIPFLN